MYLFHTTRDRRPLSQILKGGVLRTSVGKLSFSRNPYFAGDIGFPHGFTFVYPEEVIMTKYGGEAVDYAEDTWQGYKEEEEVFTRVPVKVSDAIEVLPALHAVRKYGSGRKYHYKDVRKRTRVRLPVWGMRRGAKK